MQVREFLEDTVQDLPTDAQTTTVDLMGYSIMADDEEEDQGSSDGGQDIDSDDVESDVSDEAEVDRGQQTAYPI